MSPPVVKPTDVSASSPNNSTSQRPATSSTTDPTGAHAYKPELLSQPLTSQSAARAAGALPPMTKPK